MIDTSERNVSFVVRYPGLVWVVGCIQGVKHRRNNDLSSATSCIQIVVQWSRAAHCITHLLSICDFSSFTCVSMVFLSSGTFETNI